MTFYPGIYRAKAVQVTGTSIECYVPAVYGDVSITVTDFLGPVVAGMGYVFFQAGNPEFPVWASQTTITEDALTGLITALGDDLETLQDQVDLMPSQWAIDDAAEQAARIAADNALAAADTALDGRVDDIEDTINGSPSADTNLNAIRWNTAWGKVAIGSLVGGTTPATGTTQCTSTLTFTPLVGRRYVVKMYWRAMSTASTTTFNFVLRDGVTNMLPPGGESWALVSGSYQNYYVEHILGGDGVTRNFNWAIVSTALAVVLYADLPGAFYIEDVGPINPAVIPVPTPPATTTWTTPTLINSWTVYGGGYQTPQYRRIDDMTYLRGLAARSADPAGASIFTLPAGFRPPAGGNVLFPAHCATGVCRVDVSTAGAITVSSAPAGTWWSFVCLDGIVFGTT